MSSVSPSRNLVSLSYASHPRDLPGDGEIIIVRLSQDLFGPGSIIESVNLDVLKSQVRFTVYPMPAYSSTDPGSGLSSTRWLLSQHNDFQQQHIPVPYEEASTLTPNPLFPTPKRFGDPLFIGGWKNRRPSWVQVVPQVAVLKYTTSFKRFQPPVMLSAGEVRRLREFSLPPPEVSSSGIMSPFFPGDGDGATGGPEASLPGGEAVLGSGSLPGQTGESNPQGGAGLPAGRSLALQALHANDAVKHAFADLDQSSITLDSYSDDDGDDEGEVWEDNMDPITFARYYAAGNPLLAKIVQEHDQKMSERLNQGIANWVEGVQSETL